nr:uncharacterized protein LOC107439510 [Parasteatoda tepidariorum]
MGIGGSTSSRPTTPISMNLERPKTSSSVLSRKTSPSSVQEENLQKPTDSCCSHFKENHVGVTRTVTPVSRNSKANSSIDDEIEEIVANTLDIVSNQNNLRQQTANLRDTDRGGGITPFRDADISSARSRTVGQKRLLRSGSLKTLQKRPSDDSEFQFDAKESLPEVDFAKFKKVNHQTAHISLLKERTKEKSWGNDILNLPDCPRSSAVAVFRLATKHDCLYAHLFRLKIVDNPACPLCRSGATMDAEHLLNCSILAKNCIYSRYWEARELLFNLSS